jgi:hypothetical protein
MKQTIRRNLILYAVQRYLFCKDCGTVLDVDSTTLVTVKLGDRTTRHPTGASRPFCNKCKPCTAGTAHKILENAHKGITEKTYLRVELEDTTSYLEFSTHITPFGNALPSWEQETLDLGE